MVVTCAECGIEFEAVRVSARLCGARCRQRAARKARKVEGSPTVVQLAGRTPRATSKPTTSKPSFQGGVLSVEQRVHNELGDARDTAMGQACLLIARRLDERVDASGAAVSSLIGRLEKLMESVAAAHAVEEVEADETNPITHLQRLAADRIQRAGIA